jgi:hypothetical protein
MSADWIKVCHRVFDKPEVIEIADITGLDYDAVVGKLVRIWCWFDEQTRDGKARVTTTYLDRLVAHPGFLNAVESVGWATVGDGHVVLKNYGRHNGPTAKARALTQRRVQLSRARNGMRSVTHPVTRGVTDDERG